MDLLIEKEDVHDKERCISSFNEFVCSYEFTFEKYMDELGMLHKSVRASPQINALVNTVQNGLNGFVNSELIKGLRDANNQDNKEYVQSRIGLHDTKSAIPTQTFNNMRTLGANGLCTPQNIPCQISAKKFLPSPI